MTLLEHQLVERDIGRAERREGPFHDQANKMRSRKEL
jgi:hypothetical protein